MRRGLRTLGRRGSAFPGSRSRPQAWTRSVGGFARAASDGPRVNRPQRANSGIVTEFREYRGRHLPVMQARARTACCPNMTGYQGPVFRLVETVSGRDFRRHGGPVPANRPFLVKGGVADWPAWQKWSFDHFADLARDARRPVTAVFQDGLVEQGLTREPVRSPLEP